MFSPLVCLTQPWCRSSCDTYGCAILLGTSSPPTGPSGGLACGPDVSELITPGVWVSFAQPGPSTPTSWRKSRFHRHDAIGYSSRDGPRPETTRHPVLKLWLPYRCIIALWTPCESRRTQFNVRQSSTCTHSGHWCVLVASQEPSLLTNVDSLHFRIQAPQPRTDLGFL